MFSECLARRHLERAFTNFGLHILCPMGYIGGLRERWHDGDGQGERLMSVEMVRKDEEYRHEGLKKYKKLLKAGGDS